jgi:Rad3-related DNA helicase
VLTVAGISVDFPKVPYDCQVKYMENVIKALNGSTNALLESPTGTGKTLCLLCATLAWQASRKPSSMELAYSMNRSIDPSNVKVPDEKKTTPYTIVYATRTHSQLAQVVSELKETVYRPRMTVLGSREQLCIHEKVSKLRSSALNHACNSLNSKRGCMYKNNLENYEETGSSIGDGSMLDIEEMVKVGHHRKICPYFYSRDFSTSADLVLLPYNYLLDGAIRKTLKLDWSQCVVIFDEAHNLERVASDAASFTLSSTDLALCIQEVQQVLRKLKEEHDQAKQNPKEADTTKQKSASSGNDSSKDLGGGGGGSGGIQKPTLAAVVHLLKGMFELEKRIDALPVPGAQAAQYQQQYGTGGAKADELPGLVFPGVWLLQLLTAGQLAHEQVRLSKVFSLVNFMQFCSCFMDPFFL